MDKKMQLFDNVPCLENEHIILCRINESDAESLDEMKKSKVVYQYLPTFLPEQKYDDPIYAVHACYGKPFQNKESLILGIYRKADQAFCGLAEFYGLREEAHKVSIGYRLLERFWGNGIATEALSLMIAYLFSNTDIKVITASTMVENQASANVLKKNGFVLAESSVEEDWGHSTMSLADKWICQDWSVG